MIIDGDPFQEYSSEYIAKEIGGQSNPMISIQRKSLSPFLCKNLFFKDVKKSWALKVLNNMPKLWNKSVRCSLATLSGSPTFNGMDSLCPFQIYPLGFSNIHTTTRFFTNKTN